MKFLKLKAALATTALSFSLSAFAVPISTDVISIVDESGSMAGEHAWIGPMITNLNGALQTAAGTDPFNAQYGLVGFGGAGSHLLGHKHLVGGGDLGTAPQFVTATGGLVLNGGFEDGYSGIDTALGYAPSQAGARKNLILVTDEDRDNHPSNTHTRESMGTALANQSALLNAVLNVRVNCGNNTRALGVDSNGVGYIADGAGGFTTCQNATTPFGAGSTIADYVGLALNTGGAVWDLNLLRAGGLVAQSFTNAFVAVKVRETITPPPPPTPVPEPGSLALLGLGLIGLGMARRKKLLSH